jgi:hypothetical protein
VNAAPATLKLWVPASTVFAPLMVTLPNSVVGAPGLVFAAFFVF